eukprot:TRINITY_DN4076_c0_g1_i1.p1 TRINITY_DN4076_c0_g1~~TRINITY_DN4076_c0_g1_i1.p1  ORF type:complete len:107 (+),score=26.96 TRINITY_DN4076_c0_g1_i1:49-321(+)
MATDPRQRKTTLNDDDLIAKQNELRLRWREEEVKRKAEIETARAASERKSALALKVVFFLWICLIVALFYHIFNVIRQGRQNLIKSSSNY